MVDDLRPVVRFGVGEASLQDRLPAQEEDRGLQQEQPHVHDPQNFLAHMPDDERVEDERDASEKNLRQV